MLARTRKPLMAVALTAALGLVACGGDDSDDEGGQPSGGGGGADVGEAGSGADVSGAGDTLSPGERAVVNYIEYGSGGQEKRSKLGVTVLRVREGRSSDFKDFNLEKAERSATPYYIDVKFENRGQIPLTRHLIEPSVEDADGQEYQPINLIILSGTFKPCPEYSKAKLRPGESFTGCSPVLVPEGKDFERVRFQGDVTEDPVFWKPE
jgi:hypothetical protein